jgi:hypothetical protein
LLTSSIHNQRAFGGFLFFLYHQNKYHWECHQAFPPDSAVHQNMPHIIEQQPKACACVTAYILLPTIVESLFVAHTRLVTPLVLNMK